MANTIAGLFDNFSEAQSAVQDLVNSGIPREDIGITANDARGEYANVGKEEKAHPGGGAAAGAGIGAVLGGIGGILVGIGALAIPGIGPILAAGPIAAALVGAGVGAAMGGLIGALTQMGVPEEEAHLYAEGVRRGGTLVTVATDDASVDTVTAILNRHGAIDIDRRAAEWRGRGWTGFRPDAQPYSHDEIVRERETMAAAAPAGMPRSGAAGEVRVPVTEEQLEVGKRPVERGGVRVYKRVEEKPVREEIALREEQVTVDRRPVDRPLTPADRDAFQERTFEVRETAEEPVVAKQARVAEEVVIRKDVNERTHTVDETVRRTDVDVQPIGAQDYTAFEQEFRRDFATRYGNQGAYEAYAPAYRYGYDLANDSRYANRDWNAVEAEARRDWEARNQGTWERFRDSVRYAWDRARGRRLDRAA